ncbi:hypothetical protein [Tautonia plasticadhaerens]|uniref:Uncharacterized protein n=1 Tax=Tautonia plasticadhaerens TaxID=2527974 RepID=A0A518H742_9BACT|nr:hypothetical protein [Tautonia plasticadhaerens]QDV36642.1 hypothetical protein ElP_45710 [Tautonia plasticadhaerens]
MNPAFVLLDNIPWFAWIAIVAIVFGSLSGVFAAWFKHRERMAMIQQGMNPDSPEHAKAGLPEL